MQEVFEKIIKNMKSHKIYAGRFVKTVDAIEHNNAIDVCVKEVEKAAAEYNNGWIPCSERLPDVPEGTEDDDCPEFNVTIKGASRAATLRCSSDGTWFDEFGHVYPVIAWQPLPELYRPCTNTDCVYNSGNECPASEGCAGYETKGGIR